MAQAFALINDIYISLYIKEFEDTKGQSDYGTINWANAVLYMYKHALNNIYHILGIDMVVITYV